MPAAVKQRVDLSTMICDQKNRLDWIPGKSVSKVLVARGEDIILSEKVASVEVFADRLLLEYKNGKFQIVRQFW